MVDKVLARHACLAAYLCEDGCRNGITGIFLRGIELDDRTSAQHGVVGGVVLLAIVGMPGMGIVGRNHEGLFNGSEIVIPVATLRKDEAFEHLGQEGASSSLLGLAACFLIVEDGQDVGGGGDIMGRGKEGF